MEQKVLEGLSGPISNQDCKILHADMLSMVHDIHSCQDNLTESEHERAKELFNELDTYINSVAKQEETHRHLFLVIDSQSLGNCQVCGINPTTELVLAHAKKKSTP